MEGPQGTQGTGSSLVGLVTQVPPLPRGPRAPEPRSRGAPEPRGRLEQSQDIQMESGKRGSHDGRGCDVIGPLVKEEHAVMIQDRNSREQRGDRRRQEEEERRRIAMETRTILRKL